MRKLQILFAFVLVGCSTQAPNPFIHTINSAHKPWNYEPSGKTQDEFTFAIIGDLNSGEREGVFEIAVEQINLVRPDLILSIGDLIDGGTEDTTQLKKEYDFFDQRVAKAKAPFFHVGGNHDLTNITMRQYWEQRYGKRYYHFVYKDVLFLVIDSEDYAADRFHEIYLARKRALELLDSGKTDLANQSAYFQMQERATGQVGEEQSAYFEKVLAENPNVRWTFLFMHKPVWKREGDGNLARIEAALKNRNYTLFNGHLHDYSYTNQNDQDYIMLATTGGGQNAKSESSFDHITLVSMTDDGPVIANLRMDGILDKTAKIPLNGDQQCFQASECVEEGK